MRIHKKQIVKRGIAALLALIIVADPVIMDLPTGYVVYAEEAVQEAGTPEEEAKAETSEPAQIPETSVSAAEPETAAPTPETSEPAPVPETSAPAAEPETAAPVSSTTAPEASQKTAAGKIDEDNVAQEDAASDDGSQDADRTSLSDSTDTAASDGQTAGAQSVSEDSVNEPAPDVEHTASEEMEDAEGEPTGRETASEENPEETEENKTDESAGNAAEGFVEESAEESEADLAALEAEAVEKLSLSQPLAVAALQAQNSAASAPVVLAASDGSSDASDGSSDASDGSTSSIPRLQSEINSALSAMTRLSGRVQVILQRNVSYEGDVSLTAADREVADDFELELVAEDAGDDGISGDGYTVVNGNITIYGIKVLMNSIMMGADKLITVKNAGDTTTVQDYKERGGSLVYNGTKNFMNDASFVIGKNSSAEISMADDDDTVSVELESGAKDVIVDMGDGLNFVDAVISGGNLTVRGGSGTDTVTADVESGAGKVSIDTGDSYDELTIIDNGGSEAIVVNTGGGDDVITLDVRANAQSLKLNTGLGGDTITIAKGDYQTAETIYYNQSFNLYEVINDHALSVVDIVNGDDNAEDRVTVDVNASNAIKGIRFTGGRGTSVLLTGTLELNNEDNVMARTADGFRVLGENGNGLEFNVTDKTNYTDNLINKKTVNVTLSDLPGGKKGFNGASNEFTNYVIDPTSIPSDLVVTGSAQPLLLSNVVIAKEPFMSYNDSTETISIQNIDARNLNVLLKGREINLNGTINAQNVRAEALRGTQHFAEALEALTGETSLQPFSIKDSVEINVNSGAKINAAHDIALLTEVKHHGGMLTILPESAVNVLNIKIADAHIRIRDGAVLRAGYGADGTGTKGKGSVELKSEIETVIGYEYKYEADGSKKQQTGGMPISLNFVFDDASVEVEKGAKITAADDVLLRSVSTIKATADANTGMTKTISVPFAAAMNFVFNDVHTTVKGEIDAGRKALVSATGSADTNADALRTSGDRANAGAFVALNVLSQNVRASIDSGAKVTAGGDVSLMSSADAESNTEALSSAGKEEGEEGGMGGPIMSILKGLLSPVFGVISDKLGAYFEQKEWFWQSPEKSLDKLLKSVSDGNYSAKVVNPDAENAKKGTATVKTEELGEGDKTSVRCIITVDPKPGCYVEKIQYRYLKPAEDHYTYVDVDLDTHGHGVNEYAFTMLDADVEVIVTWAGRPNGNEAQKQTEAQEQASENQQDAFNIGGLLNDAQDLAGSDADTDDEIYHNPDLQFGMAYLLKYDDKSVMGNTPGKIVTWLTTDDNKRLDTVYEGRKVLFIPNPKEGYELALLTVSYEVTENGKKVKKTDTVTADAQGRYIYTAPEGLMMGTELTVKPTFQQKEDSKNSADQHNQITGAGAIGVVVNQSDALIEEGTSVTAGGTVDLFGIKSTKNVITADGTAVTDDYAKIGEAQKKAKEYTTVTKKNKVTGAIYAVQINSTVPGAVSGTMEHADSASAYYPRFYVNSEYADKIEKVYLSYYTMLNVSGSKGKRVTDDLTASKKTDSSGRVYFQPDFNENAVVEGTVLQVNFVFKEDEGAAKEETGTEVSYLVRNPIAVSVNAKVNNPDPNAEGWTAQATTSIGEVTWVETKDGKYYFNLLPDTDLGYTIRPQGDNYQLDHKSDTEVLYASWRDSAGNLKKAPLIWENNYWYFSPEDQNYGVPEGALVTINAVFAEDTRQIVVQQSDDDAQSKNGTVSLSDTEAKKSDEVTVTLSPKEGYFATGVTFTWMEPTNGGTTYKTMTETRSVDPADGSLTFYMKDVYEGASLRITPHFSRKTITVGLSGTPDGGAASSGNVQVKKDQLTEDGKAASGQKLTIEPSEEMARQGYKVYEVSYTVGGNTITETGDQITIGTDYKESDITINAKLKLGEIEVKGYEDPDLQGQGKIEPAIARADRGDTVIVKITAPEGQRAKSGSVKFTYTPARENGTKTVQLTHVGVDEYSFVMPDVKAGTSVQLEGKFEKGSDEIRSMGISVAVGVTDADNNVQIQGGTVTAGDVSLMGVSIGGKASTEAKAGFNKSNTGAAGALGVQVASFKTDVSIRKDDNGSLTVKDGGLFVMAKGKTDFTVTGDASGAKKANTAENTGVGAGIAIAIDTASAVAQVEDGVKLKGNDDKGTLDAEADEVLSYITINGGQKTKEVITAKAGAAGGKAVVPVLALDVFSGTAGGSLGKLKTLDGQDLGTLGINGKTAIKSSLSSAKAAYNHAITADASASGRKSALGGSFIVTWINSKSDAILNQSLRAVRDIAVSSSADDSVKAVATASAKGGKQGSTGSDDKGSADRQADAFLNGAGNLGGRYGDVDARQIRNGTDARQNAETAENTVSGAGAFILNMQQNHSLAEIMDGADINTDGRLSVTSQNRTDATVKANASSTDSDIGVGVGIAINVVTMDNIARIGNGAVRASDLEVSATVAKAPTVMRTTGGMQNQSAFQQQLEEMLSEKMAESINSTFGTKIGSDSYFASILPKAAASAANKLIEDLHLEKLFQVTGDGLDGLFQAPIDLVAARLKELPEALYEPFRVILQQLIDTGENLGDGDTWLRILDTAWETVLIQGGAQAFDAVKTMFYDNATSLLASAFSIVGNGLGGSGWSGQELKDKLKVEAKKTLGSWIDTMIQETINRMGAELPVLTENNKELTKKIIKEVKEGVTAKGVAEQAADYVLKTFREQVYDYEALMIDIGEHGFRDYMKTVLTDVAKQAGVTLVNESLDALAGALDVKLDREPVQDRHIITTQAISGAGAAEKSGAGSLAIAVANLTTTAEIGNSTKEVNVNGDVTINAEELRRIRTHSTAAVDENGDADNKTSEGDAEEADTGGTAAAQTTESFKNIHITAQSGYAQFDPEENDGSFVILHANPGYKLTDGAKVMRTYSTADGEVVDELTVRERKIDGKVEWVITPRSGLADWDLEDSNKNVTILVEFEEDLRTLPTPNYKEHNEQLPDGAVTLSVVGREASDGAVQAKAGDTVQIAVRRLEGQEISSVFYDGVDLTESVLSSNKDEVVYGFTMPEGDVGLINVIYSPVIDDDDDEEENAGQNNGAKDAAGRSVGVGAAFTLTYGNSEVTAKIGERSKVDVGSLSVDASSVHEEENYATAGTEPLEGTDEDKEKEIGVDAAVSINILDNDIRAEIAKAPAGSTGGIVVQKGDLEVNAYEEGDSETKASAFATGSSTIVGATVAVNLSMSDIQAIVDQQADVAGDVSVTSESSTRDQTWAFATALGSDVQKALNKVANIADSAEEKANKAASGEYFDDLADKWKSDGSNSTNQTSKKINSRFNLNKADGGSDAAGNLSVSTNALRSQNVQQNNGQKANDAVKDNDIAKNIQEQGGQAGLELPENPNEENKKLQVAASVGVMVTNHAASTKVNGKITSGGAVQITSSNDGNFNTRSTGAAMSVEKRSGGHTIAAAVGVSVDKNKATVEVNGGVQASDDVTIASDLSQNMNKDYVKRIAVQSISGAVSGKGTDNSIAGAVSMLFSNAESTVRVQKGTDSTQDSYDLNGRIVKVTADDKSKLGIRAGGISASSGASRGAGLSSAVLVSNNTVIAEVGDGAKVNAQQFDLTATKLPVSWEDAVSPYEWSDLMTDTSSMNDEERENVYTGLIDIHRKPGELSYSIDVNLDSHNIMKVFDALNILAYKNYYAEAIAGTLAVKDGSKLNGAGSVSVVTADNTVKAVLGKAVEITVTSPEKKEDASKDGDDSKKEEEPAPTGGVTIFADGTSNARVIGGAISGGKAKNAVGVTMTYFGVDDEVETSIADNAIIRAAGAVKIGTKADADIESFNAAATIATGKETSKTLGGSVNVLNMGTKGHTDIGDKVRIDAGDTLLVTSKADMDLVGVTAGIQGSGKGIAAGGTVAVIIDAAQSLVDVGANHALHSSGDLTISADTTDRQVSVSASASGGFDKDGKTVFAGSINAMVAKTKANVTLKGDNENVTLKDENGEKIGTGLASTGGSVAVTVAADTRAVNVTAGLAGSKGTAIGLSVNGNWFDKEALVTIEGGKDYTITAARDVLASAYGDDTTVLAALGVSGSTGGKAGAGTLQLSRSADKIKTKIRQGTVTAGGEAAFASAQDDNVYSIAGSVALSNKDAAYGATVVMAFKDSEVETILGEGTDISEGPKTPAATDLVRVTAGGAAGTLRNRVPKAPDFKGIYVGAIQDDVTVTVSAGAAVAKESVINANLAFLKNTSSVKADTSTATLTASAGSILQKAASDSTNWVAAGGFNYSKEGTPGAGAAAVGIYAQKNVDSVSGSLTAQKDVSVLADNRDRIRMLAVNVGVASQIAVDIGAAVQVVGNKVHAMGLGNITAQNGSAQLNAKNDTGLLNAVAAVAVNGNLTVAPAFAVVLFDGETQARAERDVTAAKNVTISATADKTIDQYAVGAAIPVKGIGISGTMNWITAKDAVLAYAGKSTVKAGEALKVDASSDYTARAGGLSFTFSSDQAAAGITALVHILKGKTEAEIAGTASAKDVSVLAHSARDIIDAGVNADISGGFAAAGATVMVVNAGSDKLSQDAADAILYGNSGNMEKKDSNGNVIQKRENQEKVFDFDQTLAQAKEQGLDVDALQSLKTDLDGNGVKESDAKVDPSKASITEAVQKDQINIPAREQTAPEDMVMARITKDADVTTTGGTVTVRAMQPTAADLFGLNANVSMQGAALGATVAVANFHSNVSASSMGTLHLNGGKVYVDAESTAADVDWNRDSDETSRFNQLGSSLQSQKDQGFKTDLLKRSIRVIGASVEGGMVGLGAAVSVLHTDNVTQAVLGGRVEEAGAVTVHGDSLYDNILNATLNVALGISGASLGASVAYTDNNGELTARIDESAVIQANKAATAVDVTTDSIMRVTSVAPAIAGGGYVGGNAGVSYAANTLKQITSIDGGATIRSNNRTGKTHVNVAATSHTDTNNWVMTGSVNLYGNLQAGVALGYVKPTIITRIGEAEKKKTTVDLQGAEVNVRNRVSSELDTGTGGLSGSIGVTVGASILRAYNETNASAKIENATVKADTVGVSSALKSVGDATVVNISVGAVNGGIANTKVDLSAENTAAIDTTGGSVEAKNGIKVDTGDSTNSGTEAKAWSLTVDSAAANLGMNYAETVNKTVNKAQLIGSGTLRTTAGVIDVSAYSKAVTKATGKPWSLSAAEIKPQDWGYAIAENHATSQVDVDLKDNLRSDLKVRSEMDAETTADNTGAKINLVEIASNYAKATGDTKSLINVNLEKGWTKANSTAVDVDVKNVAKDKVKAEVGTYTPFSGISVAGLTADAQSTDLFDTNVRFGEGYFNLKKLDVATDYDTSTEGKMDASGLGLTVGAVHVTDNDGKAVNNSYAATTVTMDGSNVKTSGDVSVKTTGKAEANSSAGNAMIKVVAVDVGKSDATAELNTTQTAMLELKEATLNAGGDLAVESTYSKADATANVGSMGAADGYSFELSLIPVEPFEASATQSMVTTSMIKGSGATTNRINAKNLEVTSGAATVNGELVVAKANAFSKGQSQVSVTSAGNINSNSDMKEKVYTAVDGVGITAVGNADIKANAVSESVAKAEVPEFNLTLVSDFRDISANANIGEENDRQTAKILIGDGTSITSTGAMNLAATNTGDGGTRLQKGSISPLASTMDYEEHTKEYLDTGVQIGRNGLLKSDSTLDVTSTDSLSGGSNINTWDFSIAVTTSDALGNIKTMEDNVIIVGDNTSLISKGNMNLKTASSIETDASVDFTAIAIGADVDKAKTTTDISRMQEIGVGRGASLTSTAGAITLRSASGEADHIRSYIDMDAGSFLVSEPEVEANTYLKSHDIVRIGDGAKISALKDVSLLALNTSTTQKEYNDKKKGIYTETKLGSGAAIDGSGYARSNLELDMETNVYLNRGRSTGTATVESKEGAISLLASNDGMVIDLSASSKTAGLGGTSKAVARVEGKPVQNQVWVDNAILKAAGEVQFLAANGISSEPSTKLNAYARQYGAGSFAYAYANTDGKWYNFVSTYDRNAVAVTASGFTHEAKSAADTISLTQKADGWGLLKNEKDTSKHWSVTYHCDFCVDATEETDKASGKIKNEDKVKDTEYYEGRISDQKRYDNWSEALKNAFEKALLPLTDIRKLVDSANNGTGISRARYGEEDYIAAGKVFVLALQVILQKDMRLTRDEAGKYRLWNNSATQLDIYLLPNSARLYMAGGAKLQFVVDTLRGDALGDGNVYDLDIINALTDYAFRKPLIPVGSAGSLDFGSGELKIPANSDLDLYLHEVSSEWFLQQIDNGVIKLFAADQEVINASATEEAKLPEGELLQTLTEAGAVLRTPGTFSTRDGYAVMEASEGLPVSSTVQAVSGAVRWDAWWFGYTPDSAPEDDTPLYFLLVNPETDEVDAYRTSCSMLENGEEPVDVSAYLYRDSEADRKGDLQYDLMFFDTPKEEYSGFKAVTDVLGNRMPEVPRALGVKLRSFTLDGSDLPSYSISGHLFAMNDATDGRVSMFDGFYTATFDGDTFESDYTKVEGIRSTDLIFTIKGGQPVWPEWTSEKTAEDLTGNRYYLEGEKWYTEEEWNVLGQQREKDTIEGSDAA